MATMSSSGPRISLKERDRRYTAVRERLKERGVDCAVVEGTNLFYLTNGLPGEKFGMLPTRDEPFTAFLNNRHLVDVSPQVLIDAQDWISDIRPFPDASAIAVRLRELRLEQGTIGLAGISGSGGFSHGFVSVLQKELPNAKLVDVLDIFLDLRTTKSAEEVAMIERANLLFDIAVERVGQVARPGMRGIELQQEGIKAMWEAGGDLDGSLGVTFAKVPNQNPILGALSRSKPVQAGDIVTLTAHSEYGHYAGHSDAEISIGEPKPMHRDMFAAVLKVREAVLKAVKPGTTQRDLVDVYENACKQTGFRSSPHSQIHQYGIDVPEFPGPSFNAPGPRNFELKAGMIYSISPTLLAPDAEDLLLGGTSLVVTESGYRELGDRKVELAVAPA